MRRKSAWRGPGAAILPQSGSEVSGRGLPHYLSGGAPLASAFSSRFFPESGKAGLRGRKRKRGLFLVTPQGLGLGRRGWRRPAQRVEALAAAVTQCGDSPRRTEGHWGCGSERREGRRAETGTRTHSREPWPAAGSVVTLERSLLLGQRRRPRSGVLSLDSRWGPG